MYVHIRAISDVLDNMYNVLCIDVHGYRNTSIPTTSWHRSAVLYSMNGLHVALQWESQWSRCVYTTEFKMVLNFDKKVKNIVKHFFVLDFQAHKSFAKASGTRG
ncbi:hypothetical protein PoB_002222600 [Plakobranchus ocellatus]|uniref:Uncharacterized protein n=1 Tax=Plakobranchus ocellatus TaxID=259542 RepID=A0AAV3Z8U3_9GAST|nr:hypothetical protein PoB_002222600 [Plakobranchus ocellatus]